MPGLFPFLHFSDLLGYLISLSQENICSFKNGKKQEDLQAVRLELTLWRDTPEPHTIWLLGSVPHLKTGLVLPKPHQDSWNSILFNRIQDSSNSMLGRLTLLQGFDQVEVIFLAVSFIDDFLLSVIPGFGWK